MRPLEQEAQYLIVVAWTMSEIYLRVAIKQKLLVEFSCKSLLLDSLLESFAEVSTTSLCDEWLLQQLCSLGYIHILLIL